MPALLLAASAYVAGTVVAATVGGPPWATAALVTTIALAIGLGRREPMRWLVLPAAVLLATAGHARFEALAAWPPPPLAALSGLHEVEGIARADEVLDGSLVRVDLDVTRVDGQSAPGARWGGLRVSLRGAHRTVSEGDRVELTARLDALPAARAPDYAAYLASRNIDATAAYPARFEVHGNALPGWRNALHALRRRAVTNIERVLPEPEAALAAGILIGKQGALPARTAEALRLTGTTHLIVVSGQNVAMLLGVAIALLTLVMSRRHAALATLALLVPYVALVGAEPPVVRAAVMAVGIALASVTGRRTPGWVYLVQAVAIMLALDPLLARDVAFQLSATATAGVMVVAPALRDGAIARLPRAAEGWAAALIEATATAAGAALAVLPVQVAAFGRPAPWSIVANVLVAPVYEATFVVSAIAAVVGAFRFGASVGVVLNLVPSLFLGIVDVIWRLPGADVTLHAPLAAGVTFYAALGGAVWWLQRRDEAERPALDPGGVSGLALTVGLAAVAGGLWIAALTPTPALASVTVLDVGQGLAVLVRDGGHSVLVDAGPPDGAALRALAAEGLHDTLDLVIVSHRDSDHSGGLPELRRRLVVRDVRASRSTLQAIRAEGQEIDIGDRVRLSERTSVEVLGPPVETHDATLSSINDNGIVVLVRVGDVRVLLPADIEAPAESWLVGSGEDLRADALVVPHHGSSTSSTRPFLDAVQPAVAIVSVGAHNAYGHPVAEVMARYRDSGVPVYRTDESGSVTLRSEGSRLWVAPEHASTPVPTRTPSRTPTPAKR